MGQRIGGSGQPAQQFGMTDILNAGRSKGFLVDRGGGHRVDQAALAQLDGFVDELEGGAAQLPLTLGRTLLGRRPR